MNSTSVAPELTARTFEPFPARLGSNATRAPEAVVAPVPPLPTESVPVTPVVRGSPVTFVKVPLDGVPSGPPADTNEFAVLPIHAVPFQIHELPPDV